ncbi:MAG: hypothetical protein GON13_03900 [Nanoarchaeota archaeon]|nr:hypothetical protein [Nanoarchaeota archaeon]
MASKTKIFNNSLVKGYLEDLAGLNAVKVAKSLPITKVKSEYDIAGDIKININKLRSILYKFYSKNLVLYNRQRDIKKGWYIYHWKFYPEKLVQQIVEDKEKEIKKLDSGRGDGDNQTYMCSSCRENFNFTQAFNNNFTCTNCAVALKLVDTKKLVNKANKERKRIEKEIVELKKLL